MKRFLCVLSVCLLCICAVAPVKAFAYDLPGGLDTDDMVTYGLYDYENDELVESDPIQFGSYFDYAFSRGIYDDINYTINGDGLTEMDFSYSTFLNHFRSNSFFAEFRTLALNGWLFNLIKQYDSGEHSVYLLVGVKTPSYNSHPSLTFSSDNSLHTYSWYFEPFNNGYGNDTSVVLVNSEDNILFGFTPGAEIRNYSLNAYSLRNLPDYCTKSNLLTHIQENDCSLIYFEFDVEINWVYVGNTLTYNGVTFSFSSDHPYVQTLYKNPVFYSVPYVSGVNACGFTLFDSLLDVSDVVFFDHVCVSVFPFYESSHVSYSGGLHLDLPPISVFYPTSSYTSIYLSEFQNVVPTPTLAPGVSPTPPVWITPTPYPTFAPPTPSPGAPVENYYESIGSLMTLLIRHYDFVISGYTIAFSPFYVFMACVIMGLAVRVFFGGSHE